jgi:hypothetical protein
MMPNEMLVMLSLSIDNRSVRPNKMPEMLRMPIGKRSMISLSITKSLE